MKQIYDPNELPFEFKTDEGVVVARLLLVEVATKKIFQI